MATEKLLISLDEALEATHKEVFWTESEQAAVRSFLVKQPKVDAAEVIRGHWRRVYDDSAGWIDVCSICGEPGEATPYCSNCGTKMDLK